MSQCVNDDGRSRRRTAIGLVAAVAMLVSAGGIAYRHWVNADQAVTDELLAVSETKTIHVACQRCRANYSIPAKDYMAGVADQGGANGIKCQECGHSGVWRAAAPIEFTADQWNAGFAGQDVLVSELKAYLEAHPEGEPVAASSEREGI
ncbi:MAG: hypothetical protein MI923_24930 [Phycisphaerales bacterium]|nr:hypothetical protein [Phycisphaerales bacterium]